MSIKNGLIDLEAKKEQLQLQYLVLNAQIDLNIKQKALLEAELKAIVSQLEQLSS